MNAQSKVVDGFRFMPPSLRAWLQKDIPEMNFTGEIPWTPLRKPIAQTTFSLMTSAGIGLKIDEPFDMDREKREPTWGDPTHREIPCDTEEACIELNHLHINTRYIKEDLNVMLPMRRFCEFEDEGIIGHLARTCYSYYGYQLEPSYLLEQTMPKVAAKMKQEGVEAVMLTPA